MRLTPLMVLLLLCTGCNGNAVSQQTPAQTPSPATTIITEPVSGPSARKLTLRLTLSSPADLQVKEGDRIEEGSILSDRVRDRDRLKGRIERIQLQITKAQRPIPGPAPARQTPEIAGLPPASFLSQVAEVERMRLKVEAAERDLQQQQRMVDMVTTLPDDQVPEAVLPHEEEVLAARQRDLDQAKAELVLAQAKLSQAQNDRQYQEYQHSISVSNRLLKVQENDLQRSGQLQHQQEVESDRQYKLSQLDQQKAQLEMQLLSLATVRSPFKGRIQRLKWEGQNDQDLIVELTLVTDDDDGDGGDRSGGGVTPAAGTPTGSAGTSP